MDSDRKRRKQLAVLPFSEKVKILEKLRDRSRAIAASGLRNAAATREQQPQDASRRTNRWAGKK